MLLFTEGTDDTDYDGVLPDLSGLQDKPPDQVRDSDSANPCHPCPP